MKKKAKAKQKPKKDQAQIALSVVEQAIGGKLVPKKKPTHRESDNSTL